MPTYPDQREYAKAEAAAWAPDRPSTLSGSFIGATRAEIDRTTLDDVHGAMGEARSLAARVMALVDRLCGPTNQECGKANDNDSYGVFPQLRNASGETLETIRQAQTALNRLDRELP